MPHAIRWKDVLLAAAIFSFACAVYTFPLVIAPTRANRLDSPDALLNSWIVSWNLHQLRRNPFDLYDTNIFFPETGTLAYSENLVTGALIAAPVAAFSQNPIVLFNAVLFGAFVLTGVATCVLAYDLTGDRLAAVLAGFVFSFAPYRFAHIPHLQLQLAFGIPLSLFLVRRIVVGNAPRAAAAAFSLAAALHLLVGRRRTAQV